MPVPEPSADDIRNGADLARDRWSARHLVDNTGQKALLMVIASHCDNTTLSTFLTNETLAVETAMSSKNTLARHITALAERRSIATIPLLRKYGRGQAATLFILNPSGWLGDATTVDEVRALVEARYMASKRVKVPFTGSDWSKLGHDGCPGLRLPGMFTDDEDGVEE